MEELVRVTRGVWRPASQLDDLLGRAGALLDACPPDSVIAGVTAARLHGLWLPPWLCHDSLPCEVIVHRDTPSQESRPGSRRRELRARRQRLDPGDVAMIAGLPVVTAAKAWIDLAARLSAPDLVALGDSALRGGTTSDDLAAVVGRAEHCRGVVKARTVLPLLDGDSRSRPESHLRYALVSRGLPPPKVNKPIFDDVGDWLAEPDLSYEQERLALEYNGADHAEVERMQRDITRETDVDMRGGWLMITFGPTQVLKHPEQAASRVRLHLRERANLPSRDPWSR